MSVPIISAGAQVAPPSVLTSTDWIGDSPQNATPVTSTIPTLRALSPRGSSTQDFTFMAHMDGWSAAPFSPMGRTRYLDTWILASDSSAVAARRLRYLTLLTP